MSESLAVSLLYTEEALIPVQLLQQSSSRARPDPVFL